MCSHCLIVRECESPIQVKGDRSCRPYSRWPWYAMPMLRFRPEDSPGCCAKSMFPPLLEAPRLANLMGMCTARPQQAILLLWAATMMTGRRACHCYSAAAARHGARAAALRTNPLGTLEMMQPTYGDHDAFLSTRSRTALCPRARLLSRCYTSCPRHLAKHQPLRCRNDEG